MDAVAVTVELDAVRLSDWIQATGLSRSSAYELLKLLGVEPEARRVPSSRKPVSHLTAGDLALLQPWADELRAGATLPQLRDRIGRSEAIRDSSPGSSEIIRDSSPGSSQTVQADLATALATALTPPVDPLRRAKALAEAAELGVALSSAELAEVVGVAPSTVGSWPDGHSPRPGFTLHRQKLGAAVWWTVERQGTGAPVRAIASASGRSVGFASFLTVEAVCLPYFNA